MSTQIVKEYQDGSQLILLENADLQVWLDSLGATIRRLKTRDREGQLRDVVLGHPHHEDYEACRLYFGATAGRVCNRIAKGRFELHGEIFQLPVNNGPNSLHGGEKGFSFRVFEPSLEENSVTFYRLSPDGEEGYPGNLQVFITYSLEGRTLKVRWRAETDQTTLVNLTNHAYFNLEGTGSPVGGHLLQIAADTFGCVDADGLADGTFRTVAGSPFDFRAPRPLAQAFDESDEQIRLGHGLDHHFVFSSDHDQVRLYAPATGIELTVSTTQPGAQVYSANFVNGEPGLDGQPLPPRCGLCIETQKQPDDIHINRDDPTTLLRKEEVYDQTTSYTFRVKD